MRYIPKSLYYSNPADLLNSLDTMPTDQLRKAMEDIIDDNSSLTKITERAAATISQYKQLVELIDGIIVDDDPNNERTLQERAKKSITEIFLRIMFAIKDASYWMMILSDQMEKFATKDSDLSKLLIVLKSIYRGILSASRQLKYEHPSKKQKIFFRNLESSKVKNGRRKLEKKVSASTPANLSENEKEDNKNTAQNNSETVNKEADESIPVNSETLEEEAKSKDEPTEAASDEAAMSEVDAEKTDEETAVSELDDEKTDEEAVMSELDDEKTDEELEETALEASAEASESDSSDQGENNTSGGRRVEQGKKKEKVFEIYFKNGNLFRNGVVESDMTYPSISRRRNTSFPSSSRRKRNSFKYNANKNSRPSHTRQNDADDESENHYSDSETVSKGQRRYKRKRTLSSKDSSMNGQSEYEVFEATPKRQRLSNSSSNRSGGTESGSKGRGRYKKGSLSVKSETATKSSISPAQPKRGRRRRVDIMRQKMEEDGDYTLKYACVHVSDVLEDPSVQHYADIIRINQRKRKANSKPKEKQKRSRDRGEIDENSLGKDVNETEVEWSVLDAVSDEEERESNNDEEEESREANSDNEDDQATESETDQKEVADDNDQEQPGDEELETNSSEAKQTDESCHPADQDESSNHSETKQCAESPSNHLSVSSHEEFDRERKHHKSSSQTPDSHRASSPEVFHTEDENEAESLRSDEEEGDREPSPASEPSKYGKKGPRTPPPPPMLLRGPRTPPPPPMLRGPRTPPGLPEVSEDEDIANSSD